MKTLVVIPTFNEKENLERTVEQALAAGPDFSVLVVDDDSPDGTGAVADSLAALHDGRVFTLHRAGRRGLGGAYREAFAWGIGRGFEALCEMDADGQHDPAALPGLAAAVEAGADLAIGSRRVVGGSVAGWNARRDLMSRTAMWFTRFALRLRTHDVTAGFRCYRAGAAARLLEQPLVSTGYAFQEEATFYAERLGFRIVEVPIVFERRRFGESKLTVGEAARFITVIAVLWWRWESRGQRR